MSDIAIEVSNLSKRYRIGLKDEIHDTFIGSVTSWLKSPISNYRRVHSLASFSRDSELDDVIWALKDASFEIKQGEIVGVIGKNGAGKSTLLKILSRIIEPTEGEAIVNGNVSSLLEVGTGFHPELTGRENLYLNGALLGMKRDEIDRKFDEIIDFSGVDRFVDTPVKRYSSGMYVRLAFSIAAHLEPDILLVDEVLSVGDIEFQRKCLGKMDEVAKRGRTVLFVSHNMGSIGRLCKTAILLEGGRIRQQDDVNKVITQYVKSSANNTSNGIGSANFSNDLEKEACIKSIRVLDDEGKEKIVLDQSKPFMIEVTFYVNEQAKVYASVTLSTVDETIRILNSREVESSEMDCIDRKSGQYASTLKFPGGILNSGVFYARVGIKSMGISCDKRSSPTFELVDFGALGNYQTTLIARKRGILALPLKWTSRKI